MNDFDFPNDPVFKAAKTSGKLALLSEQELEVYSKIDSLIDYILRVYLHREDAVRAELETQHGFRLTQQIPP